MPTLNEYLSMLDNAPHANMPTKMDNPSMPQMAGNGLSGNPQLDQMYRQHVMDAQATGKQPLPIGQFIQMLQQQGT